MYTPRQDLITTTLCLNLDLHKSGSESPQNAQHLVPKSTFNNAAITFVSISRQNWLTHWLTRHAKSVSGTACVNYTVTPQQNLRVSNGTFSFSLAMSLREQKTCAITLYISVHVSHSS